MVVFRRKLKVAGKVHKLKTWSAKFVYRGKLHQRHGLPDRDTAQHWLDSMRIAKRRGEVGYEKVKSSVLVEPLVSEYAIHLRSKSRDVDYVRIAESRLMKMVLEIPWMQIGDIQPDSFEAWRRGKPKWKGRKLGARTLNQYLDLARQFADWLWKSKRILAANTLLALEKDSAPLNKEYRRAATLQELGLLLKHSPPDRAMVYLFLTYIPLRRRALAGIQWRDLRMDAERPTLILPENLSKTKREAKLAIRADVAGKLQELRRGAKATDRVFDAIPTIDELRSDLAAAGVDFDDGNGKRRFDLHSFRKTAIRLLKQSGVSLDEAHVFLQHKDRKTTERHYDDDQVDAGLMTAAEKMPSIFP